MEQLLERCAGLDVHKAQVTACARVLDRKNKRVEVGVEFSTMAVDLLALRDWLKGLGVTHVAMEATGVYWKCVYYVLEDDFELLLVNAQHVKQVPGRKTDVQDAQWLCRLLECGLLRASFVPPKPIREMRDLTRYRKSLIGERQRETNRLQKVLEDAGVKLACVASRVLGVSGRAMLDALVAGTRDPEVIADLARGKLRRKLRRSRRRWTATSPAITRSSSPISWRTSTISTRSSRRSRGRSRSAWPRTPARLSGCARSTGSRRARRRPSSPSSAPT